MPSKSPSSTVRQSSCLPAPCIYVPLHGCSIFYFFAVDRITKDLSCEGRFDVPGEKRGACEKYLNFFAQSLVAARLEPTKNRCTLSIPDPPWCDSVDSNTV